MTLEPERIADAGADGSPDAALLSRFIHAHRDGRPDAEEMAALADRLGPVLKAERTPMSRLASWLAPAAMSVVLVAAGGWAILRTNEAPRSIRDARPTAEVHPARHADPPPVTTSAVTAPALDTPTPALSVRALPDVGGSAPSKTTPRVAEPTRAVTTKAAKATAPSYCDDVELIERAGTELRSGQAARALATTEQHHERCPDGVLAQERERIAIEALAVLGRNDEARARASAFESRHPSSPHLRRVRQVVGALGD